MFCDLSIRHKCEGYYTGNLGNPGFCNPISDGYICRDCYKTIKESLLRLGYKYDEVDYISSGEADDDGFFIANYKLKEEDCDED